MTAKHDITDLCEKIAQHGASVVLVVKVLHVVV